MNITDRQLYRWVAEQRSRCDDPRRRALLEKIPGWTWTPQDDAWENGFNRFKAYGKDVAIAYKTKDGFQLGMWVNNQRQKCVDPDRRKRLESLPFWRWEIVSSTWEKNFLLLEKHGATIIQTFKTPDGHPLGKWAYNQRYSCKDPERRKRLESLPGWVWIVGRHQPRAKRK